MEHPRKCVYDIETSPRVGLFFGNSWNASIAKTIADSYVMGFSYKDVGKRGVKSVYIWDFPLYKKEPTNDIEVVKVWRNLMLACQDGIIIGHNSDSFDNKLMMGRLIKHGMDPIALPNEVDTKKAIKRVARFDSNKLDDLGQMFEIGKKKDTGGIDLWWDCMNGDKKAQRKMVSYCEQDVKLTERLYLYELPYMSNHPNMAVLTSQPDMCRSCGVNKGFLGAGFKYTKTGKYRRWQCKNCRSYNQERTPQKIERPELV